MDLLQNILIYAGSFVLVLSVVVFVHEFGHFQVGRWCGVAVKSFSIGLGSEWFGWTDKHGTRWKISRIPLGGFVSWIDDTDGSSTRPASEQDQTLSEAEARERGHFRAMPLWKRAATVAAGPLTNFIFSILAFATLALVLGRDVASINGVEPNSPAASAGLQAGDVIRSIDGTRIDTFQELQRIVTVSPNRTLSVLVRRSDQELTLQLTPRARADDPQMGSIGVSHDSSPENREPMNPAAAIGVGATNTWQIVAQTGAYIGNVFTGRESGNQIAGPLGIINVSGQVASSALNGGGDNTPWTDRVFMLVLSLLNLAAVLSVAVGIVNLLPIPVLDGGHLLFYAIEGARGGKPLPPLAQEWAFRAGFAVMASLFLFATWNDITRLFPGAQ